MTDNVQTTPSDTIPAESGVSPGPVTDVQNITSTTPDIVVETPTVVEPVTDAPTPAEQPKSTPEVSPEAVSEKPIEVAPTDSGKTETFLAETEKPAETKAETKTETENPEAKAEATENDGGQTDVPAPPPTFEAFTVPEGVTLDQERVGKFTELLSRLELDGKADHSAVQKFGQEAVDFHVNEVNRVVEDYAKSITTAWEKQKNDWKEATVNDPDIGGNRLHTTLDAARSFIRIHGGTEDQQQQIRDVMEATGLGNHPVIIRLFASAYRDLGEAKPLTGGRPVQSPKSKTQTLYGKG